jgi:hypothetical protein
MGIYEKIEKVRENRENNEKSIEIDDNFMKCIDKL